MPSNKEFHFVNKLLSSSHPFTVAQTCQVIMIISDRVGFIRKPGIQLEF